ncbi:MAG: MgtC/SapB family protein, partial [Mesorhizobium sp.]|nr:MgtC/SapB family protein [Mesorhizobium sp.]
MGAQVVTGIGFLGAGLIIRDGSSIKGLSTSATIWSTGSVGVFIGFGFLLLAAETAMLILVLNSFLPTFSRFFDRYSPALPTVEHRYVVKIRCARQDMAVIRATFLQALNTNLLRFRSLGSHPVDDEKEMEIEATLFSGRDDERAVEVDVAMQYNDSISEMVVSYCNNINTIEGGTHLTGFRAALTRTLNQYAKAAAPANKKDLSITGEDFKEGLTAIVS